MLHFKKACCTLMAGVLTVSVFSAAGCRKKENTESSGMDTSIQSSESTENTVAPLSSEAEETVYQNPASSSETEAKKLAQELGLPVEDLHGKYDFFLKFADAIIHNPGLIEYRGFVVNLFPIVADHIEEEDEEFFLSKLKELRFESAYLAENAGEFRSWGNEIRIFGDGVLYETEATYETVMHELTHFVDAFIDGEWEGNMALVDGRLAYREDITEEQWINADEYLTASFIVEGGAELYTGKYFTKSPMTYPCPHNFLTGFEWIYGSDALDELFFSENSTELFIGYMKDAGYTDEQIVNVINSFNHYTYSYVDAPKELVRMEDVLIDLYEHEKNTNWKDDKIFCKILTQINQGLFEDVPLKHTEVNDILMTYCELQDFSSSIIDQIDQGTNPGLLGTFKVMILDDKPYLTVDLLRTDEVEKDRSAALLVEYDFDTGKVLSYDYYVHVYPKVLPEPLPDGKDLSERLDSFIHDSSPLHNQKPYSETGDMKELYARAAELGNKYGVYIRLGDDLPPYAETYVFDMGSEFEVDNKKINDMLDLAEKVLSRFPEGYFDQFNYGYYKGFEICIFKWPLYYGLNLFNTEDGYIMSYSMDCVCTEDPVEQERGLIQAIFDATDLKLRNYFENMSDPMFSESIWNSKNPATFYYTGYLSDEVVSEEYANFSDYVVSKEALHSGRKDRILLMEALFGAEKIPDPCKEKARFYCQCIREAFDDSTWPEKTSWEETLDA